VTPLEFRRDLWRQVTSPWATIWHCLRDPMFSRFDTIPACDKHMMTACTITWQIMLALLSRTHVTLGIVEYRN